MSNGAKEPFGAATGKDRASLSFLSRHSNTVEILQCNWGVLLGSQSHTAIGVPESLVAEPDGQSNVPQLIHDVH